MLGSITVSTYILLLIASSVVGILIGIVGHLLWDLHKSRKTVEEPPTSPDPDYPEYDPTSADHDERMAFEFDEIEREYMASIMEDHERGAQMMGLSFEESNTWGKDIPCRCGDLRHCPNCLEQSPYTHWSQQPISDIFPR